MTPFIILYIVIWILKMVHPWIKKDQIVTETNRAVSFVLALTYPLLLLANIYIWNTWVHQWINFPEINDIRTLFIATMFL